MLLHAVAMLNITRLQLFSPVIQTNRLSLILDVASNLHTFNIQCMPNTYIYTYMHTCITTCILKMFGFGKSSWIILGRQLRSIY